MAAAAGVVERGSQQEEHLPLLQLSMQPAAKV